MSRDLKKGEKQEKGCDGAEKVVVAVKASKDIAKTALVWALTHVVQPGDCITLLVVISSHTSGKYWALLHVESSVLFLASFFALIDVLVNSQHVSISPLCVIIPAVSEIPMFVLSSQSSGLQIQTDLVPILC